MDPSRLWQLTSPGMPAPYVHVMFEHIRSYRSFSRPNFISEIMSSTDKEVQKISLTQVELSFAGVMFVHLFAGVQLGYQFNHFLSPLQRVVYLNLRWCVQLY